MTENEFDCMKWRKEMKACYDGHTYRVAGCNLRERLLRLDDGFGDDDHWVRCENVQIVELDAACQQEK